MDPELQKEMEDMALERGRVLANFAYIEDHVSFFIINHYLKGTITSEETAGKIRHEIFEDENFGFWLKFKLLEKILTKYYPEEIKDFPFGKMRRMMSLRNTIAHAQQKSRLKMTGANSADVFGNIILFHGGIEYDAPSVISEYNKLTNEVSPALIKLGEKTGTFSVTNIYSKRKNGKN